MSETHTADAPTPPRAETETLETTMQICWNFAYAQDSEKLRSLYRKAKQLQWDAEDGIDWDAPIDPSRPVVERDGMGMFRVPLVQKLDDTQKSRLRAHLAAHQLSQIVHGEQGALMTSAALTHAVPDYEGKLYSATQSMDEARHVEVFERYIRRLALVYPMSGGLKKLIDVTLTADHWVKIAIGMNMIVEGLALGTFHNMLGATHCPVLTEILKGVLRDEARHVAFGNIYVAQAIGAMHEDEREEIADFAFDAVRLMRASRKQGRDGAPDPSFSLVLDNCNIDREDFFRSVLELVASGERAELPRDQVHAFKHLMMPALVRVGAVTARARERYEQEGIPVWEDKSTLERMEAAEPESWS